MYKHALIPVALDHEHTPEEALAVVRRLLDKGGKVTALHVMEPLPGFAAQYVPEQQQGARVAILRERLQAEIGDAVDVEFEVIEGNAGRSIVEYASRRSVDLIVVASHRPGLQDYLLGSTAGRVVRHAQCAVHVLR